MKKIINRLIESILAKTPENPKKETDKSLVELFGIIAALSIIFLIWFNYPSFINWMDSPSYKVQIPFLPSAMIPETLKPNDFNKIGERFGTYGDAYGSLNTLFSGFAFAILIISLFMQRQELKEQRKELAAQREEISKSNDIAESQRKITEQQSLVISQQLLDSKVQAFYQLFFKYIDEKGKQLDSLKYHPNSDTSGHLLVHSFRTLFENKFKDSTPDNFKIQDAEPDILDSIICQALKHAHMHTNYQLLKSGYFEYICFILRFIEENKSIGITGNSIRTFIAFQNIDEMYCMLLIALYDDELFDFIEKYALLRKINIYEDDLLEDLVTRLYSENAYSP